LRTDVSTCDTTVGEGEEARVIPDVRTLDRRLTVRCVVLSLVVLTFGPMLRSAGAVTLRGAVRGVSGGGPIAGARAESHRHGDDSFPTSGISAANGSYSIWLPRHVFGIPAVYDVTFRAFGYEPSTLTFTVVDESTVRQSVRLTPLPTVAVSGVVKHAADETPVVGANVVLKGTPLPAQQTDASGAFTFPAVPPGRYEVEASSFCEKSRTKPVVVAAQNVTTELRLRPASDAFGHHCEQIPFAWLEGVTPAPFTIPDSPVALPFPVIFYGTPFTQLYLASTGVASFPRKPGGVYNDPLPDEAGPNDALYPFWDEDVFGRWTVATVGVPPDRTFVAKFENRRTYADSSKVDFEMLLHERDSGVVFQYRGGGGFADGRFATIGIENGDGSDAFQLGFENSIVRDGLAVRLTPPSLDIDGDGVPNAIDVCPGVPDPDQLDRDGDDFGNACDDLDGPLRPTLLQIRRSTSLDQTNGRIVFEGQLSVHGPDDSMATPDGLTLRLSDSLRLDQTIAWTGDECRSKRNGGVYCRRKQAPRHVAQIEPLPSNVAGEQSFAVHVTLVQLQLDGPFVTPLRITLTNDPRSPGRGIDRVGTPTDCIVTGTDGLECTGGRDGSASRAFLATPAATLFD
jgi:hypothetical protein